MLALLLGLMACGAPAQTEPPKGGGLRIVTTVFPVYDWVKNVVGEGDARIDMLLDTGVDLHSFQPTAQDILKIASCDMFLFVGGESDAWVADALKGAGSERLVAVNLLRELGDRAREEETPEGMAAEETDPGAEGPALDEHIWLSLKNAAFLADVIGEKLASLDEKNAGAYRANAAAYGEKLLALNERFAQAVSQGQVRTLVFADRFPFRYLTEDYGLAYYAAFSGCSAETEASFETVAFLAGKVDELGLSAVLTIEGGDQRIAQTVIQSTRTRDQRLLALDSMQSVTARDVQNGASYLAIMERNLTVLTEALMGKG